MKMLLALGLTIILLLVLSSPSVNAATAGSAYSAPAASTDNSKVDLAIDTVVSFDATVYLVPTVLYDEAAVREVGNSGDWVLSQVSSYYMSTRPAHNGIHTLDHAASAKEGAGDSSRISPEQTADRNLWPSIYQI